MQVADGAPVDWDAALDSATDSRERELITSLRVLERVARVYGAPAAAETATLEMAPRHKVRWGHLELRDKLGEGGFAEVWRAWDTRLEREVALKLLKTERGAAARVLEEGRMLA